MSGLNTGVPRHEFDALQAKVTDLEASNARLERALRRLAERVDVEGELAADLADDQGGRLEDEDDA